MISPVMALARSESMNAAALPTSSIVMLRRKGFVGSPATVIPRLQALADELQLDELVVNTWATEPQVRRHSYRLLAEGFGLDGSASR